MLKVMYCGYNEDTFYQDRCTHFLSININPEDEKAWEKSLWFCSYDHMLKYLTQIQGIEMH